ncbi:type II secretion system F family protein [Vulgatibacter incomptus]|uniref:Type II/IV secretion system protein TadC, associated with Flp pilus assembly n=1 Tax=Vulgatibacter incomptus TaxID=1391653 RepID=A0A0K1PB31_9BACT|nr:type II secretion system F family protein [Vulgatibacter incomptus]AKU90636.1 Type II/IV secretion system protein TadC, associated with Flp pilus assembly [Vulgatibacter incomptus]
MLASIGIPLAVALAFAAAFFGASWALDRWFGGILGYVRSSGGSSGLQRLRPLLLQPLGRAVRRWVGPGHQERVRQALVRAGEPAGLEPSEIVALQIVALAGFLLVGAMIGHALDRAVLGAIAGAALGAGYPRLWLREQIQRREKAITRALPFGLDLLTLSVEAGLDFSGALGRVVEKGKHGPLRDELAIVLKQLRMGRTREDALKQLAERVRLPAVASFVTTVIQADRMGTSLGKVMRIQATQLRQDRSQRAEKLAGEAPVKMLFPLIACIFPTVFLVLFGPIVFAMAFGGFGG